MARLVIFGAGDIARLAHYYFSNDSDHEVVAFAVDRDYRKDREFLDCPLVAFEEVPGLYPADDFEMFVALSYAQMNRLRAAKVEACKAFGYRLVSYISSRCSWLTDHEVGTNCFILEDNTVQPFVRIEDNVTLWSGNHIGHDSVIKSHTFVTSHVVISGNCEIGSFSFLGVNCTVADSVRLAEGTLVGAGAVVMKDTVEGGVYVAPRATLLDRTSDAMNL